MIEQLDQGCIRFVHFSKENELRSRVFSEKMGLESGWNCHISLTAPAEEGNVSNENTEDASLLLNQENFVQKENVANPICKNNRLGLKRSSCPKTGKRLSQEETVLLPRCSASVPEMVLLAQSSSDFEGNNGEESKTEASSINEPPTVREVSFNESFTISSEDPSTVKVRFDKNNLQVDADLNNANNSSSIVGSSSSAVLSPDSFPEMYELAEQPTPLGGIDLANRVIIIICFKRPNYEFLIVICFLNYLFYFRHNCQLELKM